MTSTWNRTESLDPGECMTLLGSVRYGRIGLCGADGPQVLPVNHTVLDGAIVFRTDLYTALADGTRDRDVAFEADELDELDDKLQFEWSVLVVGRAEHLEDRAEVVDAFQRMGQPWAPGARPLVARITPSRVTGRRFLKS